MKFNIFLSLWLKILMPIIAMSLLSSFSPSYSNEDEKAREIAASGPTDSLPKKELSDEIELPHEIWNLVISFIPIDKPKEIFDLCRISKEFNNLPSVKNIEAERAFFSPDTINWLRKLYSKYKKSPPVYARLRSLDTPKLIEIYDSYKKLIKPNANRSLVDWESVFINKLKYSFKYKIKNEFKDAFINIFKHRINNPMFWEPENITNFMDKGRKKFLNKASNLYCDKKYRKSRSCPNIIGVTYKKFFRNKNFIWGMTALTTLTIAATLWREFFSPDFNESAQQHFEKLKEGKVFYSHNLAETQLSSIPDGGIENLVVWKSYLPTSSWVFSPKMISMPDHRDAVNYLVNAIKEKPGCDMSFASEFFSNFMDNLHSLDNLQAVIGCKTSLTDNKSCCVKFSPTQATLFSTNGEHLVEVLFMQGVLKSSICSLVGILLLGFLYSIVNS